MTTVCDSFSLQNRTGCEQVKLVYQHLPGAVVPPVFAAVIVAALLHNKVPPSHTMGWLLWVTLTYFTLPPLWYRWYRKSELTHDNVSVWGKRYIVLAILTAVSWGAGGVLLYVPDQLFYQMFLACILFASAAAVMVATSSYTPGYIAGIIPLLAPLTVMFLLEHQFMHYILAILMVMVFFMLTFFQQNMNKSLTENITLRFDRERLVSELEIKNRIINEANQNKSRFLAAASHDLKQPIHAQQLFLMELDARAEDPEIKQILYQMKLSVNSMYLLLEEVLTISKLESGNISIERSAIMLDTVLNRVEQQFRMLANEKKLRLVRSGCSYIVDSDPAILERIIGNYVQNAIRYTDKGSVAIVCCKRGDELEIQVRDSGPGIGKQDHDRIFEGFVQLGHLDDHRGHGLGLAIVKHLAVLLDHDIGVRSRPGQGSTFYIRVPLSSFESADFTPAFNNTSQLSGAKILVADDDHSILRGMALMLDRWQCDYVLAPDMKQSLKYVREDGFIPDILIVDYHLRTGKDGIALIDKIRELTGNIRPAILITSDMDKKVINAAKQHGCIIVHKPVDPVYLYNLLSSLHSTELPQA